MKLPHPEVDSTFLSRLQQERAELAERTAKLDAFLHGTLLHTLPQAQWRLLQQQLEAMRTYLDILDTRLALLAQESAA